MDIALQPAHCPAAGSFEASLEPGAHLSATFAWKAEYTAGLPVRPQSVPIRATVGFDRQNGPPSYPPDYTGIRGSWVPQYKELQADLILEVAGERGDRR